MSELLPIPNEEDIEGWIDMYERNYGVRLTEEAHKSLGGQMRFPYLTRIQSPANETGGDGMDESHLSS